LASQGNAATAEAALEEALIFQFLGSGAGEIVLRSDNGLVFTSRRYTATAKAYGLSQEFITPYTPEQNGLVERFIRTLKKKCLWQHRFGSLAQAREVIRSWIRYYNLQFGEATSGLVGYQAPSEVMPIAALSCAKTRGLLHLINLI